MLNYLDHQKIGSFVKDFEEQTNYLHEVSRACASYDPYEVARYFTQAFCTSYNSIHELAELYAALKICYHLVYYHIDYAPDSDEAYIATIQRNNIKGCLEDIDDRAKQMLREGDINTEGYGYFVELTSAVSC